MKKNIFLSALLALTIESASAAVKLPPLISDGMVVQSGAPLVLWGTADPGETVKVDIMDSSGKALKKIAPPLTVQADDRGGWRVMLPELKRGGSYQFDINGLNVKDVACGDVFICSGQSNMELPVKRVMEMFGEEVRGYSNPDIRQFLVPQTTAFHGPQDNLPSGSWKECNPENAMDFSALAYFFAKKLNVDTGVPVGIINSSWGGTPIEAWISQPAMESWPEKVAQKKLYEDDGYRDHIKKLESENYYRWNTLLDGNDPGLTGDVKWYDARLNDGDWKETDLVTGHWGMDNDRGTNRPVNGSHWLRKHISLSASQGRQGAVLRLGCIEGADSAYVNGVFVGTVGYQYPPRIYNVPAETLREGDNVITIRVVSGSGEPKVVPEKPYSLTLDNGEKISLEGEWKYHIGTRMPQGPGMMFWHYTPVVLYDAMINPLFNYPVSGAVWYQGESNVSNREEYYDMLKAMMSDWRKGYGNDELPFYIVELADFLHPSDTGGRAAWAEMRKQQARVAGSDPNATLIKNSDLGEWNDIHPLDKKTLGERVASAVLTHNSNL